MRLVPINMPSPLNLLIPKSAKDAAIKGFLELTSEIDAALFGKLVVRDISLWDDLLPETIKKQYVEGAKNKTVNAMINVASESMILDWIIEARPDLSGVFYTPGARLWLIKQINEIRLAITGG